MSMPFKQSGAVLIIALVVLLLLSMLGISSMQGVVLETQKTTAFTDDRALFLHAESVLSHITREIKRSHHLIDACPKAEATVNNVCVSTLAAAEKPSYEASGTFRPYAAQGHAGSIKGSYTLYLVEPEQQLNPELNYEGLGTYMYELTVKAEDQEANKVKYLRSIITRSYN